jgi:aerobic carbon-monoxide dehydrogenase medium subunit
MKPPNFLYAAAHSLDEALALTARYGSDAMLLAGGQSLVAAMNFRFVAPRVLIDLNRVNELSFIRRQGDRLWIGAMTRHRMLEFSQEGIEAEPMLARVAREIGPLAIRNRGTIGGSIAYAHPAAEWPLISVLLGAELTLRSATRSRSIQAREFFVGAIRTAADADEILTQITFPAAAENSRFGFCELSSRPGDLPIVASGCRVSLDEQGVCSMATLAIAGADEVPRHIDAVAKILCGSRGEPSALNEAATAAARAVSPRDDVHATANYRRRMVAVIARRALEQAFESRRNTDD